jgi:ABC-type uncharacterized transport system permease subunit
MKKLLAIFTRRSLRVDILTACGGLLLITVLVVIFYFYRNSTRVVLMLSDDLMEQTTQAVTTLSAPLQVEVPAPSGESFLVDAKVVGGGELESAHIIRFTGMDEAAAAALDDWLSRG